MNSLTKSAVLVAATLVSATTASSLRTNSGITSQSAAARDFMSQLKVSQLEQAFIEQASNKYNCPQVGNLMTTVAEIRVKNHHETEELRSKCTQTHTSLESQKQESTTTFIHLRAQAMEGTQVSGKTSPNAAYDDAIKITDDDFQTQVETAATLVKSAQDALDSALADIESTKELVKTDKKAYESKIKQMTASKEQARKVQGQNVETINTALKEDNERIAGDLADEITTAEGANKASVADCQKFFKERTSIIQSDENVLEQIKPLLQQLKLCPAAGTAASFLEVDAAQRIEASCSLSRSKMDEKATKFVFLEVTPDDLIDEKTSSSSSPVTTISTMKTWEATIVGEKLKASTAKASCTKSANDLLDTETTKFQEQAAEFTRTTTEHANEKIKSEKDVLTTTIEEYDAEVEKMKGPFDKSKADLKNKEELSANDVAHLNAAHETQKQQVAEATRLKALGHTNAVFTKDLMIKEAVAKIDNLKSIEKDAFDARLETNFNECTASKSILDQEVIVIQQIISKVNTLAVVRGDSTVIADDGAAVSAPISFGKDGAGEAPKEEDLTISGYGAAAADMMGADDAMKNTMMGNIDTGSHMAEGGVPFNMMGDMTGNVDTTVTAPEEPTVGEESVAAEESVAGTEELVGTEATKEPVAQFVEAAGVEDLP